MYEGPYSRLKAGFELLVGGVLGSCRPALYDWGTSYDNLKSFIIIQIVTQCIEMPSRRTLAQHTPQTTNSLSSVRGGLGLAFEKFGGLGSVEFLRVLGILASKANTGPLFQLIRRHLGSRLGGSLTIGFKGLGFRV